MPGFNLNKEKTAQSKIHDKMLGDQQSEVGTGLDAPIDTTETYLEDVRGEGQGSDVDVTTEGQMQEPHKAAADADQVTQGQLEDGNMRDPNVDGAIMKPMDALSEAYHQKHRDAFAADNKVDNETKFWDDFVGTQLERDPHKVIASDPSSGSQLQNNPELFKDLDKPEKLTTASVEDLDREIFATFYDAASANRDLSDVEAEAIVSLSKAKTEILNQIQDISED